jgi:hypothetical protein
MSWKWNLFVQYQNQIFLRFSTIGYLWIHGPRYAPDVGSRALQCTGNGLVVPSSSLKREVAGSILAGCTKTFLFPLSLLPHRLMSHFDIWRHLSFHTNPHKTLQQQDNSSTRQRGERKVLPLQSTGEERKEEINSTVQLVMDLWS